MREKEMIKFLEERAEEADKLSASVGAATGGYARGPALSDLVAIQTALLITKAVNRFSLTSTLLALSMIGLAVVSIIIAIAKN